MNERPMERPLSTADMAAAAERTVPAEGNLGSPATADVVEPTATPPSGPAPLLAANDAQAFRARWDAIQTGFVDEPRRAVEQADTLVAEVMQRLAQVFAEERANLEGQWGRGADVSTEDLRLALQRYRSFFDRLLSV